MSTTPTGTLPSSPPATGQSLTHDERLALANRLYREYHTLCFWHRPRDLVITEDLLPLVVKGLRKHGGRRGFILSAQLQQRDTLRQTASTEGP